MQGVAMLVVAILGVPFLTGALLRLRLRNARPDMLSLFAAAAFLFVLEYIPVAQVVRMHTTVTMMFSDPFTTFSNWLVALLFGCAVLARVAIPYLLAHRGVWVVDRLAACRT